MDEPHGRAILIAPTAFKGTIGAGDAANAIADGIRRTLPDAPLRLAPLSDGGPGLVDALALRGGALRVLRVSGPVGEITSARVLVARGQLVAESADACGLHLVEPAQRDPLRTTTVGVGELMLHAAQMAAADDLEEIVLGLGGSATVDGGAGMAQALGWRLLDAHDRPIGMGGAALERLARIEPPPVPRTLPRVIALADVHAPLLGERGAAAVFAPQKGAAPEDVPRLEAGLARFAKVVKRDLGTDVAALPGAGAAGGLGAGAVAFLGAELRAGADWVLDAVEFDAELAHASLVVTGEGSYDAQTAMGKVVGAVLARAAARGVPALLLAGRIESAPPSGVLYADGAGAWLDAGGLADLAHAQLVRLLSPRAGG